MIGGAALTVARQAVLRSDLPEATPSLGIDRACCSGLSSLAIGTAELRAGMADLLICGGLESLSTTPRLLARSATIPVNTLLDDPLLLRSEEHTSELQSLMRISYAVFCLKKKI